MKIVKPPIPEGIEKRESKLYGLCGILSHPATKLDAVAFGGYFRHDTLDSGIYDGQLIDLWGPSTIEGGMDEKEMSFIKQYDGRNDVIQYNFKKKGDLWVGDYYGQECGRGPAQCVIYVADKDAFQIVCGKIKH